MNISNKARRRLLKSIAASGTAIATTKNLPESWRTPIVNSMVLPGHAMTSCCITAGNYCTQLENNVILIIELGSEGSISVLYGLRIIGTGTIDCTGDTFSFSVGISVSGEVNCESNTISGTVGSEGYTAILDGPACPSN